jgi:hypothetical protein
MKIIEEKTNVATAAHAAGDRLVTDLPRPKANDTLSGVKCPSSCKVHIAITQPIQRLVSHSLHGKYSIAGEIPAVSFFRIFVRIGNCPKRSRAMFVWSNIADCESVTRRSPTPDIFLRFLG